MSVGPSGIGFTNLLREVSERFPTLFTTSGHSTMLAVNRKRVSPEHDDYPGTLILDFPASRTGSDKFLLFRSYLVCDILL